MAAWKDSPRVFFFWFLVGGFFFFISESCERCEYVYLKWKQEMSYSCAENVAQLSRVQRWFKHSTGVKKKKKKKKNSPTKAVRGLKLQSKQIRWPACSVVYRFKSGKPLLNLT